MNRQSKHTPRHLYIDNGLYFITGAIYLKRPLIIHEGLKQHLLELIRGYFRKYNWELHHWVILDDHYHVLGKSLKGKDLSSIIKGIHKTSGLAVHKQTGCRKPVWWNYWDYCCRDEIDYMTRLNYLLYNPVKHGYTENLKDYLYSSFNETFLRVGREKLVGQFRRYPEYKGLTLVENEDNY